MGIFHNTSAQTSPFICKKTVRMDYAGDKGKSGAERINPYSDTEAKGAQVEHMFDSIAPAYDFMNAAMTFGLHRIWRSRALNKATKKFNRQTGLEILDIATGTGDLAFYLSKKFPCSKITGVDLSSGMLEIATRKLDQMPESTRERVSFRQGDCLDLSWIEPDSKDLLTVAYGVRNFESLKEGLRQMHKVLKPGGTICIIELSCPRTTHLRFLYDLYSRNIIPGIGKLVSGDRRAYSYLPESIAAAPQREALTGIMEECGFRNCTWKSMTFGAVTYYIATK